MTDAAIAAEGTSNDGACERQQADEIPEVDARLIPPTVRHGAILGALSVVQPGDSLIVAAPHDPFPLLAQIDEREGDNVRYSYVQRGPDVWRVLLERVA